MSQIFQFIHFPANASAKYGFTKQKLSTLRSEIVETSIPKRLSENPRDEIWLFHSSYFSDPTKVLIQETAWAEVVKILLHENGSDLPSDGLGIFDLEFSASDFMEVEASNPYWLLNQLYCQFDLRRQALQSIDSDFKNFTGSNSDIQTAVTKLLPSIELADIQYFISPHGEMEAHTVIEGSLLLMVEHDELDQCVIVPKDHYNRSYREIISHLLQKVIDVVERREIRAQLETVQEKFSRSQKALIQSEKLSVAGKMTAAIAHEINNPLQGVRNCFHLVSNQNVDVESKEKYLEMTNQELDRLTKTVQRMLEFYRPNEEFHTVQLLDVLEHTLNLLQGQLMEYDIKVKTSWPLQVPPIQGIADQIEQVFMNLILNARDFMHGGGSLWITIEVNKPFVTITFEDSGPGVADDYRDKIFEPFVSSKGTAGLGLSVCHEIISNHQGVIELMDDIEDRGARFKIILPIKQREQKGR